MRITWRGLELPTRVEKDMTFRTINMAGFLSSRSSVVLVRQLAIASDVFCFPLWKAVLLHPLK